MTCDPSSTTRFEGILKNAVMLVALRNIAEKSSTRQYAISLLTRVISVSRPRKNEVSIMSNSSPCGVQSVSASGRSGSS